MTRRIIIVAVLVLADLFSAVAVVKVTHMSRILQHRLQVMRVEQDRLNMTWTQLQLEESTWASYDRVRTMARTHLNMYLPKHYVVLEPRP